MRNRVPAQENGTAPRPQTMPFPSIRRQLPDADLPFSSWRFAGFAVILSLLALTFGSLGVAGLNQGLDFTGGTLVDARLSAPADVGAIRAALAASGVSDASIQLSDGGKGVLIRARSDASDTEAAIVTALGTGAEIRATSAVGPVVSGELLQRGIIASLATVLAIGVYIWLRFEARFGLAALLTTLHDVTLMVGFYAVTRLEFDLTSIAAILLIAGYSINDTVVVFDRMREVLARNKDMALEGVIDRSITSTLRRTVMTSGTTIVTSISLMLLGGPAMFGFASAVTFGIVVGTFSSIFVAAPLLLHLPGGLPGRTEAADHDRYADQAPS